MSAALHADYITSLELRISALEARMAQLTNGAAQQQPRGSGAEVASDDDLDSQWGDPQVKHEPNANQWKGDSFKGCNFSQCPPKYLKLLAHKLDYMAQKDEEERRTYVNKRGETVPTAPFKRKDAARARGWAKRNEGLAEAPRPAATKAADFDDYGALGKGDDDIPF